LFASAAICLAVIGIDVYRGRSIKMLGAGTVIVFTALGAYIALIDPKLSHSAVKLAVDIGVLTISLASLVIRKPFICNMRLRRSMPRRPSCPASEGDLYHHLGVDRRLCPDDRRQSC
jgi:hypothetical protein